VIFWEAIFDLVIDSLSLAKNRIYPSSDPVYARMGNGLSVSVDTTANAIFSVDTCMKYLKVESMIVLSKTRRITRDV
jgi:hypothetical protein